MSGSRSSGSRSSRPRGTSWFGRSAPCVRSPGGRPPPRASGRPPQRERCGPALTAIDRPPVVVPVPRASPPSGRSPRGTPRPPACGCDVAVARDERPDRVGPAVGAPRSADGKRRGGPREAPRGVGHLCAPLVAPPGIAAVAPSDGSRSPLRRFDAGNHLTELDERLRAGADPRLRHWLRPLAFDGVRKRHPGLRHLGEHSRHPGSALRRCPQTPSGSARHRRRAGNLAGSGPAGQRRLAARARPAACRTHRSISLQGGRPKSRPSLAVSDGPSTCERSSSTTGGPLGAGRAAASPSVSAHRTTVVVISRI